MPHIIVEYSKSLEGEIPSLLNDLHEGLTAQGIDKARIKTRGIAIDHAVVGERGTDGQMLHATLLLLAGRDIPTKKQYGDSLHAILKSSAPENCAATLEIRDMIADTYYL
jgi:5-carboxymethyl-2-hydroxymuconate isomerase